MHAPLVRMSSVITAWLLALAVLAIGVTREGAVAGSLDDLFVVLHEARGWAAHIGVLPQALEGDAIGRPTVEGATSPADVLVKAICLVVAPSADPLVIAGWVCFGWLAVGALVVAWGAAALGAGRGRVLIVTAGWCCSLGLIEASSYRLEGALFAAVWASLLISAATRRARSSLLLAVAICAVRPEGFVLGPAAALWAHRGSLRLSVVAMCLATAAPVLCGRLLAFGAWAPQSFVAKSSDDRVLEVQDGLGYLDAALRTPAGLALILLVASGLWCLWRARATRPEEASGECVRPGLMALAGLAAAVLVASGGDGYAGARLALPLATPIWLAAAVPAAGGSIVLRTSVGLAFALQFLVVLNPAGQLRWPGVGPIELLHSTGQRLLAGPSGLEAFEGDEGVFRAVHDSLDGETLAHRHAQRFRWFSPETKILDLTGLTSREVGALPAPGRVTFGRDAIAHGVDQGVGAFFLDVLRARPAPLAGQSLLVLADASAAMRFLGPPPLEHRLATRLSEFYVPASIPHPGAEGWFSLLVRRDLAARFEASGFLVGPR